MIESCCVYEAVCAHIFLQTWLQRYDFLQSAPSEWLKNERKSGVFFCFAAKSPTFVANCKIAHGFWPASCHRTDKGSVAVSEHLADTFDTCDEGIYIVTGVVEGEGGTDSAFDAEAPHEGFGTVVTGADGDAETVEQGAKVKVMDAGDVEGKDGPSPLPSLTP